LQKVFYTKYFTKKLTAISDKLFFITKFIKMIYFERIWWIFYQWECHPCQ